MKKRFLSLTMAICMVFLLAMTSCAAAAVPTVTGNAALASETQGVSTFTDVPADVWYAEAIAYCQQHDIMNGTSATTFAPEETMTRAMLATVLYRMTGSPAVADPPAFTDAAAGVWYSDAISWASKNSVISGYGGGIFGVNDSTTREQAVTILWRYAGNPENNAADALTDTASISDWAKAAVRWANASGILDGMIENSRFNPETNIKRGEVASMLYRYLNLNTGSRQKPAAGGKTLVAYFSATNTTRPLAEYAADILNADLYEIVPEVPYTDADLAYYTNGRADREQNDASARPAISGSVDNMADYDIMFIGYPIWHGQAPKIIYTFLESYDFADKTIVPFCTSNSSGIGSSDTNLHSLISGANWLAGRRFASGTSRSTVEDWISSLELPSHEVTSTNKINVSFNGHIYPATLADNPSAEAFAELLKNGPLTIAAHDYGSFEKVGALGTALPRSDEQITTSPGDIILYQGNQLTVYYAQNAWSFTRLGRIDDPSGLREALGSGDVEITFQLASSEPLP